MQTSDEIKRPPASVPGERLTGGTAKKNNKKKPHSFIDVDSAKGVLVSRGSMSTFSECLYSREMTEALRRAF